MPVALLSVSEKTGLAELAAALDRLGWQLIASGGTARFLQEKHLPVQEISSFTGSPEILSGRVKTLHPAIHAGILARPTEEHLADIKAQGWKLIDLVVVNLYPFEQVVSQKDVSLSEAVENIDIGGVTLIRSAAKNFERVTLLCDPLDYPAAMLELSQHNATSLDLRRRLAVKGFQMVTAYDAAISKYLDPEGMLFLQAYPGQTLRYGENPHQKASLYTFQRGEGPLGGKVLQGKEPGFNNLMDLNAAWQAVKSFARPTVAIVKHFSLCGIACADSPAAAFEQALACDPVSAYGGVIVSNRPIDLEMVHSIGSLFVECMAAPSFSQDALIHLSSKKKNCRLLEIPSLAEDIDFELRTIQRGILKQSLDCGDPPGTEWKVASNRQPTMAEWVSLQFAWKACQHVKSNAIVLAQGESAVGIGGGQPNRVDSVRIAIQRAGERAKGAAMASDGFFPFPDSIQVAAEAGITAVIHPGGSIRDPQCLDAADASGMAVVYTGVRHFRH